MGRVATEAGVDERLVQRRVQLRERPVPLDERGRVLRDPRGVVGVDELALQPQWAAVMNEVDDRLDAQGHHQVVQHFVGPAPVELARRGVHSVPRDPVAHVTDPERRRQSEILSPSGVVLRQLVLVQEPPGAAGDLADERVLDPDRPDEGIGRCVRPDQTRSKAIATEPPPPRHRVARP